MALRKNKWAYNSLPTIVEQEFYKNGNIAYNVMLVKGDTSRKKAVYLHTTYTESGSKLHVAHVDNNGDLTVLDKKGGEQRVMVTYGDYGGVIEETFMARVWLGLFKRKWIISKVNYYTEDGLFLKADSFIDPADFT